MIDYSCHCEQLSNLQVLLPLKTGKFLDHLPGTFDELNLFTEDSMHIPTESMIRYLILSIIKDN